MANPNYHNQWYKLNVKTKFAKCALSRSKYDKVYGCSLTKEIWKLGYICRYPYDSAPIQACQDAIPRVK